MKDYNIKLKVEINYGITVEDIVNVYSKALRDVTVDIESYGRAPKYNKYRMIMELYELTKIKTGTSVNARLLEMMFDDFEKSALGGEILPYVRKMTLYTNLARALRAAYAT